MSNLMCTSSNTLNTPTTFARRLSASSVWMALILISAGHSALQAANAPSILTEQIEPSAQIQNDLATLLNDSGINRLYKDFADAVLTESQQARQSCNDSPATAATIQNFIGHILNVDQLVDANVTAMSDRLEPAHLTQVSNWMRSTAGKRIMAAETNSANWSDDEYVQRELALTNNPDWNESRQRLVLRVVDASAIVTFVTALHTETTALVLQAGDCIANEKSRLELSNTTSQAQNDEIFYGFLLRNDIHQTAAMIFSDISDADLESYIEHSQSTAGKAWNTALIQSIRTTLQDRHVPLQQFLTSNAQQ